MLLNVTISEDLANISFLRLRSIEKFKKNQYEIIVSLIRKGEDSL